MAALPKSEARGRKLKIASTLRIDSDGSIPYLVRSSKDDVAYGIARAQHYYGYSNGSIYPYFPQGP
jgi:hypothetical protein